MNQQHQYLTTDHVIERLGISRSTLWRWRFAGKLRAVRLGGRGGRVWFRAEEVEALRRQEQEVDG